MQLADDVVFFSNEVLQFLRSRVRVEDEMGKVHELLAHQRLDIFLSLLSLHLLGLGLREGLGFLLLDLHLLLFVETQLYLFLQLWLKVEIIDVVIKQTGYLIRGFFVHAIDILGHADFVLVVQGRIDVLLNREGTAVELKVIVLTNLAS